MPSCVLLCVVPHKMSKLLTCHPPTAVQIHMYYTISYSLSLCQCETKLCTSPDCECLAK